jgi:hypothetical protein
MTTTVERLDVSVLRADIAALEGELDRLDAMADNGAAPKSAALVTRIQALRARLRQAEENQQ